MSQNKEKSLNQRKRILIVSLDKDFSEKLKENLTFQGYSVFEAQNQAEVIPLLDHQEIDLVFFDIERLPLIELDLVTYIKSKYPADIIILTTVNELDEATRALRNGASFYLVKPVTMPDIKAALDKLLVRQEHREDHLELEQRFLTDLMGGSPAMQKVLKFAMKIAPTSSTVLIGGESGTGKEFFARIIHRMSKRYDGRFVAMNCGAVPDTLFESELFGYKRGAFTGADRDKPGLVEEAHTGTLFLDEVGELSPTAQVKLLRFLQEREFRRVGETQNRSVDVRIIAASNKDLSKLMKQGQFREDLYFRLNVFYLQLPPLRERKETLPNLLRIIVHKYNQRLDKHVNQISKNAETILANYDYPGNVRELENIIEHAVVLAENNEISENDLPEYMFRSRLLLSGPEAVNNQDTSSNEILTLAEVEKNHIKRVLDLTMYNYTDASKKLGISRSTLWRKLKEYNIEVR